MMDYHILKDGVTQSILATWKLCRIESFLRLNEWEVIGADKKALTIGNMFHDMDEAYINTLMSQKERDFSEIYIPTTQIVEEVRLKYLEKKENNDPQVVEDWSAIFHSLFPGYVEHWQRSDIEKEWIEVESKFDVEFEGYRLRGKRDGVYRSKSGKLYQKESKTFTRYSEDILFDKLSFDFQNLFYITATEIELGEPVAGVLYNMLRKPGQKQKKEEMYDEYIARIEKEIGKDPKHYYKRPEIFYSEERKALFRQELKMVLEDFHKWLDGESNTYKTERACDRNWGSCEFLSACAAMNTVGYQQTRNPMSELED